MVSSKGQGWRIVTHLQKLSLLTTTTTPPPPPPPPPPLTGGAGDGDAHAHGRMRPTVEEMGALPKLRLQRPDRSCREELR